MKNMKMKILAVGVALSCSMAHAQLNIDSWPVYDSRVAAAINSLGEILQAQIKGAGMQSQIVEKTTFSSNLNTAYQNILQDQKKVILDAAPSLSKCVQITQSMGAGRAAGVLRTIEDVSANNGAKRRDAAGNVNFNSVTQSGGALQTCTTFDVKQGVNGCKNSNVGKFAGLDTSINAIRKNVLAKNLSIDTEQLRVAEQYISNFVYALAPKQEIGAQAVNSGIYNAYRKIWLARVSPVEQALRAELNWKTSLGKLNPNSSLGILWNSDLMNQAYMQANEGRPKPDNPSFGEIVETLAAKDFFFGMGTAETNTQSAEKSLADLNQKIAMSNYLSVRQQENMFIQNSQLGSIAMGIHSPLPENFNQRSGGE